MSQIRNIVGKTIFPILIFAFVLPLIGALHTSVLGVSLFAGAVFAAARYLLVKYADRNIKINGSSPRKVVISFAILLVLDVVLIGFVAALFPTITIGSYGLVLVTSLLYPFVEQLVIGD